MNQAMHQAANEYRMSMAACYAGLSDDEPPGATMSAATLDQAKIDAENAEKQRLIDEANRKLEAERKALEADRQAAERAEFERQAKLKAEGEAKTKAEHDRVAAEYAKKIEAERAEAERVRLDALKPDITKLQEFAKAIRSMSCPGLKTDEARDFAHTATVQLAEIAEVLESFQG